MCGRFSMASQSLKRLEQVLKTGFPGMAESVTIVLSSNVNAVRNQATELLMPAS